MGSQIWASCVLMPVGLFERKTDSDSGINLDLHSHPGSQNGWNHSGYGRGTNGVNWLKGMQYSSPVAPTLTDVFKGLMGIANAQRSLDYIRIITEFITQPQYAPVVPMFGMRSYTL